MTLFTKSKAQAPNIASPDSNSTNQNTGAKGELVAPDDPALEQRVQAIGIDFLESARKHKSGFLSAQFWSDKLMDWSMKDEAFKVQLFRFVDTFPMLKTPQQVHDHLTDYLTQPGVTSPPFVATALKAGGLLKGAMSKQVARQITGMAEKFIAGTDAATALPQLKKLWSKGIGFSVDLLGEACVSDKEAKVYQQKYFDLINNLPTSVEGWSANPMLESDHLGPIPRTNVSIKISALFANTDPIDTEGSIKGLMETIVPILETARDKNVFINFDMEQYELKDLTLELFERCCEAVDFHAGLAMQAYLRSGDDDARRIVEWSKRTGRQVTVRLVKGAYWDYETIHAEEQGWPVPVWSRKCDTDACYERMAEQFIEAMPRTKDEGGVKLALGSHNVRSIAHALAHLEKHDLPANAIELQMLHGMADQLKAAAVARGLRMREYVPVGEMIPGMAYLVRRLLENTSNESWLRAGFLDNASPQSLLESPHRRFMSDPGIERIEQAAERHQLTPVIEGVGNNRAFANEPLRDFAHANVRENFAHAIGGVVLQEVKSDRTEDDAERALEAAHAALPRWRAIPVRERSKVLINAAAIMRRRRDELSGIMIREAGKTWREADGDVCEAIDFCEYYARMAVDLFEHKRLGQFIGELDQIIYQPRGVAVVISPWNFPLAILCGMTTAALVTGNPTLIKPAGPALRIAKTFYDILIEAGCPDDVIHFMAGPGRTVGAKMVRDHRTSLIAFTGSMEVGLDIVGGAGQLAPGQNQVKKVIAEMGGKNAIIIDASADLDEAVLGVRYSAFGYQGQKCSACSRVIVVESAYDTFLDRLCESTKALVIGDCLDPGTDFGPIIDHNAYKSIMKYIEIGKSESRLALALDLPDESKLTKGRDYIPPHIFAEVPADARIANEEIFGPVLAVTKAKDFDEALQIANGTQFKLTGGVFSRKPENIEKARSEFRVGNLYINRSCTGAVVGRQPFGGFWMSGVGTKAGGPDYLLHFVEPRSICENTMRRGFAPGL
ncbi:MAG: proline dehydrogenase family protein [Planctomycetota bacterium]|nr:proline dehydrogenase family protein [Planctomycetota bacterium]